MKKSDFIGVSNLKRTLLFLSAVLVVMTLSGVAHTGYAYTTLNVPDSCNTYSYGIDGNKIVGYYSDNNGQVHGFLYDITSSTYTTLDAPDADNYTEVWGINGNNIVGWYLTGSYGLCGTGYGFVTSDPGITPSPQEALGEIVNKVIALNLHAGISNSLDSKLQNAISALDDMNENNDVAAINSLNAFINAVEAQRGNKITEEAADALIDESNAIIAQLEAQ